MAETAYPEEASQHHPGTLTVAHAMEGLQAGTQQVEGSQVADLVGAAGSLVGDPLACLEIN